MLDFPASGAAAWSLYDETGIRPEYLWPVLYSESGLQPGIQNQAGAPYYGLNQISGSYLQARGITPTDYLTWPASSQLSQVVTPYLHSQVAAFGAIRSGTRLYQANFLPATMPKVTTLDGVLARKGDGTTFYESNVGFDTAGKGYITLGDLAAKVATAAGTSAVQAAIASTYALRPGESPLDPVYGEDFGTSHTELYAVLAVIGVSGGIAYGIHRGWLP